MLVLGDQLDLEAAGLDGFEPRADAVWMAEVAEEATHVPSSRPRIALFLAAMRHFAQALQDRIAFGDERFNQLAVQRTFRRDLLRFQLAFARAVLIERDEPRVAFGHAKSGALLQPPRELVIKLRVLGAD